MVSKLKLRRSRRLKADVAWWKAEAQDWKDIAMEHAAEIDRLKKLVIRVPMPVLMPKWSTSFTVLKQKMSHMQ
jgi:hypothetical protein